MSKIRKLYFFDKKNTEEMISFLNDRTADKYINHIMFNPLIHLHHLLPLKFKFLPESYLLEGEKNAKGLITVAPTKGKDKKVEIQKLFFEENSYDDAAELVQYVTSKYKAMGAFSILVRVDDYLPSLINMLVSKCNFTQISYEKLWKVNQFSDKDFDKKEFRVFKNSDSKTIANIYNDSLLPHFRTLLSTSAADFSEILFQGLSYFSEYKYIVEDKKTKNPIGCIVIKTFDNENYILDIIQSSWVELDIETIISYAIYQIKKRKKRFGLFVSTKRYVQYGEKYEKYFSQLRYECVQNKILLTNSSAKVLKEECSTGKYTILGDFCSSHIMPV